MAHADQFMNNEDVDMEEAERIYLIDQNHGVINFIIGKIGEKAELLGALLEVPIDTISEIQVDYNRRCRERAEKVLVKAATSEQGLTWPILRRALKVCGRDNLIQEISEKFRFRGEAERFDSTGKIFFLGYLSLLVSGDWEEFGRWLLPRCSNNPHLNIADTIKNIDRNHKSPIVKAFEILKIYYHSQKPIRLKIILDVLRQNERNDLVRIIQEKFEHLLANEREELRQEPQDIR